MKTNIHEIKVESGVPIPERKSARRGDCKYPFGDMKVEQSFLVTPDSFENPVHKSRSGRGRPRALTLEDIRARIYSSVNHFRHTASHGQSMKFKTKTVENENGVRCWRVS